MTWNERRQASIVLSKWNGAARVALQELERALAAAGDFGRAQHVVPQAAK